MLRVAGRKPVSTYRYRVLINVVYGDSMRLFTVAGRSFFYASGILLYVCDLIIRLAMLSLLLRKNWSNKPRAFIKI